MQGKVSGKKERINTRMMWGSSLRTLAQFQPFPLLAFILWGYLVSIHSSRPPSHPSVPWLLPRHCSETEERGWQDCWKVMFPSHHHLNNISTDIETLPSHITCLQLSASLPEGSLQKHKRFLYMWTGPPKSTKDLTLNQGTKMSIDRNSISTQVFMGHFWGALHMAPSWIQMGLISLSTTEILSPTCPSEASLISLPHFFPLSHLYIWTINSSQINSCGQVLILKSVFRWRENKTLRCFCLGINFLGNSINNSILLISIVKAKGSWCFWGSSLSHWTPEVVLVVKSPPANAGDIRDRFKPEVRKSPWRRAWQPTPVFLLGESHGQRSLVSYSPEGHKESDMTEWLNTHTKSWLLRALLQEVLSAKG